MKRRVLVFTVDLVPFPGQPTYGGGLRAWALGQGLEAAGHEVLYSLPAELLAGRDDVPAATADLAFHANRLRDVIVKAQPDVLLFEQWGLLDYLTDEGIPTVVDLHGSLMLENSYRGQINWSVNAEAKIRSLRKVDLVIVPGHRQADYFKPWLMLAGDDPRSLPLAVIPVSMPPELPARKKLKRNAEPVFIHGGNLWPWIDPMPALEVVAETLGRHQTGRLMLFTGHPRRQNVLPQEPPPLPEPAERLAAIRKLDRVEEHGFIPRKELLDQYLQSHVAVDVYQRNAERELAITTRTIEYLWAGLPVMYGDYAELAPAIAGADAGWVVDPNDRKALLAVVESVLKDPSLALEKGQNARKLVAERFAWDRTIGPLADFCRDPRRRGKTRTIFALLGSEFEGVRRQWEGEREKLQQTVTALSLETTRLGREYDELKKAYEAHYREMRSRTDELAAVRQKHEAELAWRDEAIRKLETAKTEECRWRDEELRRREALAQEVGARHQAELDAKAQELTHLHHEMTEAVRHRDERYDALNDRLTAELRGRDEEARVTAADRAREVRELAERVSERDQRLAAAAETLRSLTQERDRADGEAAAARETADSLQEQMEQERQELRERIGEIESERARLAGELDRLLADLQSLEEEKQSADAESEALRGAARKLEHELADARAGAESAVAGIESERARLAQELASLQVRLQVQDELRAAAVAENTALSSTIHKLEKELDDAKDGLTATVARVEAERSRLQADLETALARAEKAETVRASAVRDLEAAENAVLRLEKERDDTRAGLTQAIEEVESERSRLQADLETALERVATSEENALERTAEAESLRSAAVRLERERDDTREGLTASLGQVEAERARLHEDLEAALTRASTAEEGRNKSARELEALRTTLARLEKEAADARAGFTETLSRVEAERGKLAEELGRVQVRLQVQEELRGVSLAEHAALQSRIHQLEKDGDDARDAMARSVAQVEAERSRLQQELERTAAALQSSEEQARAALALAETRGNEAQALASQLEDTRTGLQGSLATVESERARLQKALEDLTAQLDGVGSRLAELKLERDAIERLARDRKSEMERLEKELDDTRSSDFVALSQVESERARLQLSVEGIQGYLDDAKEELARVRAERDGLVGQAQGHESELARLQQRVGELEAAHGAREAELSRIQGALQQSHDERDGYRGELERERAVGARMREETDRRYQSLVVERDSHCQAANETRAALERERQHAADLQAGIAGRDDRIRWLEGVLFSMKNRLPNRLYKATTFWLRRVFVQLPLLVGLYLLNFASNLYMHWWTQRHRQQVFPGM